MKIIHALMLGFTAVFALSAHAAPPRSRPIIVGYIYSRESPLPPDAIDAIKLDRINYAFARIKDGRITTGCAADPQNFARLNALKQKNPNLKILVSVGGWLGSKGFSDAALTAESRKAFTQSAVEFLRQYNLDGLDVDWEYPGSKGAGNRHRAEDKQNFTLLLKELRSAFDAETMKSHKRLYLTIAAGATEEFLANTEMAEVAKVVDTVNLMTYDYTEPGSDPLTGHNAPLFANPADQRGVSSDASVRAFELAGVPAEKILLGVPFYGHIWGGVAEADHGLFRPGKAVGQGSVPYGRIEEKFLQQGFVRYWDPASQVPYLYNATTHVFISYDDPESMAAKGRYAVDHHLGGVMFWEYMDDPGGKLLGAVRSSLDAPTPK